MYPKKAETIKELLFLSYANLAMAHSAVEKKNEKYTMVNYMIRAKFLKGLQDGTLQMRSIFDDEKVKLKTGQKCNYCGSTEKLALDHIFPKRYGGIDNADNLILACRSCNSSKGAKDLMEWMQYTGKFLPLLIIRRYLKLTFNYCLINNLLDTNISAVNNLNLPFKLEFIPLKFPKPIDLILCAQD